MGGLVARRYIVDQLVAGHHLRATRLLTFATPHLGSQWASAGHYGPTGPQIKDMAVGSQFMNRLGLDWAATKADRHVISRHVVAGEDALVGLWSATAGYRSDSFDVLAKKAHANLVNVTTKMKFLR
jgi:hypothetical protein